ncbi:MAG: hypothetical protein PHS44_08315 [Candidatus Dojkabacteria bacterium]|nr:hypothetical protein [Candidatus Dojkabacteria bacterium]
MEESNNGDTPLTDAIVNAYVACHQGTTSPGDYIASRLEMFSEKKFPGDLGRAFRESIYKAAEIILARLPTVA